MCRVGDVQPYVLRVWGHAEKGSNSKRTTSQPATTNLTSYTATPENVKSLAKRVRLRHRLKGRPGETEQDWASIKSGVRGFRTHGYTAD